MPRLAPNLATALAMLFAMLAADFTLAQSPVPESTRAHDAFLTVAYESTDVSHVACLLEYPDAPPKWIGFGPTIKYKILAQGAVDGFSLERQIKRYARFRVDPHKLARAERVIGNSYRDSLYVLGVTDCVTFATDLAEAAGLNVPGPAHLQVQSLIDKLAERNKSKLVQLDRLPYPWRRCPILTQQLHDGSAGKDMVTVRLNYVRCKETESIGIRDQLYLVAYSQFGGKRRINIGKLADGESWNRGAVLFQVPRGTAVALQLWDADTINHDDLVFQSTFCACHDGDTCETQQRGRTFRGSKSVYQIGVSVDKIKRPTAVSS